MYEGPARTCACPEHVRIYPKRVSLATYIQLKHLYLLRMSCWPLFVGEMWGGDTELGGEVMCTDSARCANN